jgi:D-arginine dehydrogenase
METSTAAPILIVGGGVAGLGLAWALSRTGWRSITVLEREEQPFRVSSGQNAAILRTAIDAPATRALTRRTAALLQAPPPDLTDRPLVDRRGLVVVEGRAGSPLPWWADEVTAAAEARLLDEAEFEALCPAFRREGARAWLFHDAGTIDIARLGSCLDAAVRRAGVQVRTGVEVRRVLADVDGAARGVELAGGEMLEAPTVCLAAGAWAGVLGATVGASFPGRPTRRHLFTTHRDERVDPAAPIVWDDAAPFYCRPEQGGLLACVGDLDDCPPLGSTAAPLPVDSLVVRAARRALAERLPGLPNLQLERGWAAVRTLTEDDTPVVGFDPAVPGLFWCGALGGHGMSLSLGLAELAARLLSGEQDPLAPPLAPDAPRRAWTPERDWRASAAPAGSAAGPA